MKLEMVSDGRTQPLKACEPRDSVRLLKTAIRSQKLGTRSRLCLSPKSLFGVLQDLDIPDGTRDGVRWEDTSIKSFGEFHQD